MKTPVSSVMPAVYSSRTAARSSSVIGGCPSSRCSRRAGRACFGRSFLHVSMAARISRAWNRLRSDMHPQHRPRPAATVRASAVTNRSAEPRPGSPSACSAHVGNGERIADTRNDGERRSTGAATSRVTWDCGLLCVAVAIGATLAYCIGAVDLVFAFVAVHRGERVGASWRRGKKRPSGDGLLPRVGRRTVLS